MIWGTIISIILLIALCINFGIFGLIAWLLMVIVINAITKNW